EFLALLPGWIRELRAIAASRPDGGACTVASALELWSWTMRHFRAGNETGAVDELSGAIAALLAARALALRAAETAGSAEEAQLRTDLAAVAAARGASAAGATCAELVFGYRRHLVWDEAGCATCFDADALDDLEELIPGIASGARVSSDVIESDGSHAAKRGPCVRFDGLDAFMRLRGRLDGCLTGTRIAKDRAADAIARSMARTTPAR
ncbi:MAG TPA: acyl-CoA dehydrogenase, partial [Thermoanaerobaculia bacterium]